MSAYFDNNATTPLDPRVGNAMLRHLTEAHGNPSSIHRWGREAHRAVEVARAQVAGLVGAESAEIVFTASGSESNNQAILGVAERAGFRGHIVTTALEHPSVRAAAEEAARRGMETTEVAPGADGVVSAESIEDALRPDTRLVCLMLANNELGTIQPVGEVARLCGDRGVEVLSDVVQAVGKIPVDAADLGADYLTLGGHKFHGPLGVAALVVRRGVDLPPLVHGASQEGGRRAGTENVPGIVGLGEAAELATVELASRRAHLLALRRRFEAGLARISAQTIVHCAASPRLPHTSHVAFLGHSGHQLLLDLDSAGFAVSTGAACHAGAPQPSRALLAMGVAAEEALASLRVSFGMMNTPDEVDELLEALARLTRTN